jgi:hypothetical protein
MPWSSGRDVLVKGGDGDSLYRLLPAHRVFALLIESFAY